MRGAVIRWITYGGNQKGLKVSHEKYHQILQKISLSLSLYSSAKVDTNEKEVSLPLKLYRDRS